MRRVLLFFSALAALLATAGVASAQPAIVFNNTLDAIFDPDGLFVASLTRTAADPNVAPFQMTPGAGAIASLTLGMACGDDHGAGTTCGAIIHPHAVMTGELYTDGNARLLSNIALYTVGDVGDADVTVANAAAIAAINSTTEVSTLSNSVSAAAGPGHVAQGGMSVEIDAHPDNVAIAGVAQASPDGPTSTGPSFTLYDATLLIGSPGGASGPESFTITIPPRGRAILAESIPY
jgi:hypothetical protein